MSVAVDEQSFWLGDWKVEPSLNRIVRGDEIVKIDPRNIQVLQLLASKPGHVFSQAEIEKAVWADLIVTSNSVYQSIAQLRRALGDEKERPKFIETIPRRGYRLICSVRRHGEPLTSKLGPAPASTSRSKFSRLGWFVIPAVLLAGSASAFVYLGIFRGARSAPVTIDSASSANLGSLVLGEIPAPTNVQPGLLRELAMVALAQGKAREARSHLQRALEIERATSGDKHPFAGRLLSDLAFAYIWEGNFRAAEETARQALDTLESTPSGHPNKIDALTQLGYALLETGDFEESEQHLVSALELATQTFGERSRTRAEILTLLAMLCHSQSRLQEAEQLALKAIEIGDAVGMDSHSKGHTRSALVTTYLAQARYEEAEQLATEILSLLGGLRRDHPHVLATRDLLGKSLVAMGQYTEAESIFRENIVFWQQNDGWNARAAGSASALGEALLGQGRVAEASEYLARASLEIGGAGISREGTLRNHEHQLRLEKLQTAMSITSSTDAAAVRTILEQP